MCPIFLVCNIDDCVRLYHPGENTLFGPKNTVPNLMLTFNHIYIESRKQEKILHECGSEKSTMAIECFFYTSTLFANESIYVEKGSHIYNKCKEYRKFWESF